MCVIVHMGVCISVYGDSYVYVCVCVCETRQSQHLRVRKNKTKQNNYYMHM